MTYEYALVPVSETLAARVPLPPNQTDAQRKAFLANVPAEVLAAAERWPIDPPAPEPAEEPAPAEPVFTFVPDGEE
jgi:hypothetical protein